MKKLYEKDGIQVVSFSVNGIAGTERLWKR